MEGSTNTSSHQHTSDPSFWAPGTVLLGDLHNSSHDLIPHPCPTSDPNDPLNWATWRKILNFSLVCSYVFMTFVQLDIGFTAWDQLQDELGFTVNDLNQAAAVNYAALAVGCVFFIPFVHKYGRRPVYMFSTALQLGSCVWFAVTQTRGDLYGSNLISGLGGAISETIVQITIADMFFIHHHATMNGWYLFATFAGAYLGPVASGYIVDSQGWRWMWWWCVIFFGVSLILVIFFFEESKFIHITQGHPATRPTSATTQEAAYRDTEETPDNTEDKFAPAEHVRSNVQIDGTIRMKSYRQRLAMVTKSSGSILQDFYQPLILLFKFPAIAYTALTFGSLLAWFAILISVQAIYLFDAPYNFTAVGVGLMNLPPFIGTVFGVLSAGYLNDKSIVWLSRRNEGVYEPEMRLWLALPAAILVPAGILMFGLGLSNGAPWPLLAVGFGVFGFGLVLAGDIALSYAMDCYHDVIGNAIVSVVASRNMFSVVVLFALEPWIIGMGIQNLHILCALIAFVIHLLPIVMLIWGKKFRVKSAQAYQIMATRQPLHRDF